MDPRLIKPEMWAFDPVALDVWGLDAWRNMAFFMPFWEGGVNNSAQLLFEIAGRQYGTVGVDSSGIQTVWAGTSRGLTFEGLLNGNSKGTYVSFSGNALALTKFSGTTPFTAGYFGSINFINQNFNYIIDAGNASNNAGWRITAGWGNGGQLTYVDLVSTAYSSGIVIADSKDHLCVVEVDVGTVTWYIDGKQVSQATRTSTVANAVGINSLFGRNGDPTQYSQGQFYYMFAMNGTRGAGWQAHLAEDPFILMRLNESAGPAKVFRRTLSMFGTRIGSRQVVSA